jgi:hypothetical protein
MRRQWTRDTEGANTCPGTGSCAGSNTSADTGAYSSTYAGPHSGACPITCSSSVHGAHGSSRAQA